jgi:hypothetical protein
MEKVFDVNSLELLHLVEIPGYGKSTLGAKMVEPNPEYRICLLTKFGQNSLAMPTFRATG